MCRLLLFSSKCCEMLTRFTALVLLITVISSKFCLGFNVDFKHPLIYSGKPQTTFGYSVSLIKTGGGNSMLMVGAPTANSSHDKTFQPGVIYVCGLNSSSCRELPLQLKQEEIIRGRYYYKEMRDGGWLGSSIDVSSDESQFVACGHLWKDTQFEPELYLANGICYAGSTDLNINKVRRLLPLVRQRKQLEQTQYIFALGLSGLSAHYSQDGNTLLLGAPGAYRFAGTVAAVNNFTTLLAPNAPPIPEYRVFIPNLERDDDSYFGFAVTSGKFFGDKRVYYAAGAPRQGPSGKVFIFSFPDDWEGAVDINSTREGVQMGEYFGSSLCAADFNGDGYDDLVVGSPLYSTNVEEGRVYVFMNDKVRLGSKADILSSSAYEGRFGTAVTAVGDLNLDGYNDLAVGAPYEGNGAVYIFHGSISGLKRKFAQRISAADVDLSLRGFGISISKSKDVDFNFYPDLAIGASASSQAVLLRSKPIIRISGTAIFSVNHINTDIKNCSGINGELVTCFHAQLCSVYTGQHVPNSLDVQTVVNVDRHLRRVEIFEQSELFTEFNFTLTFSSIRSNCRTLVFHVKKDVQDFLTPVQLTAVHFPVETKSERTNFCANCPVIDIEYSGDITKSLSFFTGCGDDDKCISDLELDAKFTKYGPNDALVLGTDDTLHLSVTVLNKAEPAFQTILRLSIPSNIDFARIPSECSIQSDSNLTCNLGNPLNPGNLISLSLVLDLQQLTSVEPLVFNFEVTTASEELSSTLKDNYLSLTLPVKSLTGISMDGWTIHEEQFVYNRSDPGLVPLTHMYQMTKTEPSPIPEIYLEFKFPISTSNRESFLQSFSIVVLHNYLLVPVDRCHTSVQTPSAPLISFNHEDTEHARAAVMDCDSMECHVLKCTLGRLVKRDTITVNITATVDLTTIVSRVMIGESIIVLRSFGSAKVGNDTSKSTVKTIFIPKDLVPTPASIAWWIILVAVLGGLILLALLIFALYKFGFFQRKRPDHLSEENDKVLDDTPDDSA